MEATVSVLLFDRAFAAIIAFLLPGLAVLVGAATVNPVVVSWFGGASTSPSFVGFLFVVFAALAIGIVVSAIRWWIFERFDRWPWSQRPLVPRGEPVNEAKRREHLAEYEDLRLQHYYHYLALANMAVAVPIAITIWLVGSTTFPPLIHVSAVIVGGVFGVLILGSAAIDAITRYCDRRLRLLGPQPTTT